MGCDVKLVVRLVPLFCHPKIWAVGSCETVVPTYQTAESIWPKLLVTTQTDLCHGMHHLDQSVVLDIKVLRIIYEEIIQQ